MKKLLITLSLFGLTYQSQAQSNKRFEICYYPKQSPNDVFTDLVISCYAIIPIDDDSAKTMDIWFSSDTHKKMAKNSNAIVLTYCPDVYSLSTKKYQIK